MGTRKINSNRIEIIDESTAVLTIISKHGEHRIVIDTEDVERVQDHAWTTYNDSHSRFSRRLKPKLYFCAHTTNGKWSSKKVRLQQFIFGTENTPEGHILRWRDGDRLNMRKSNLFAVPQNQVFLHCKKQLRRNSASQFLGVYRKTVLIRKWDYVDQEIKGHWLARLNVGKRRIYLGTFQRENDAARAVDFAAIKHFGDEAILNFDNSRELFAAKQAGQTV